MFIEKNLKLRIKQQWELKQTQSTAISQDSPRTHFLTCKQFKPTELKQFWCVGELPQDSPRTHYLRCKEDRFTLLF